MSAPTCRERQGFGEGGRKLKKKKRKYRESASKGAPLSPPSLQITATRICFFLHLLSTPPLKNVGKKWEQPRIFYHFVYTASQLFHFLFLSFQPCFASSFSSFLHSLLLLFFSRSFSLSSQIINSVSFFHRGTRLYFSFLDT